ncbi:hypothetical protein [Streptomyces sp. NBC_01264]|uniref:hypothetical protein n=1 Tax=Streptomyces sp. NBC_01264 TaxID=2903804 RepID=UPI00224D0BF9|nr:hypothetical protein [Streptomyces sp. NBC_01264]MCX4782637.1 hypothetical protein [Streptomyces sp. NBC_01264]
MSEEVRKSQTQALQESLVTFLMEIIGAPDDEEIARNAAQVVRELDVRMAAEQAQRV